MAEPNQVLFFNQGEAYCVGHPVEGGDACLSLTIDEALLRELVPKALLHDGASPVYLTQVFQQVEAMPLYRYQLRLRLARALHLLGQYDDLTVLGLDLGFSSHSHFSQAYGRTLAEFQRSVHLRAPLPATGR